jgi:putative endonuclease
MNPEPWYIYIAQCSDKTLYIGISNDVNKRIEKHNSGKGAAYTRGRAPLKLLYQEKHLNKSEASKREIELKKLSRKKKFLLMNLNK